MCYEDNCSDSDIRPVKKRKVAELSNDSDTNDGGEFDVIGRNDDNYCYKIKIPPCLQMLEGHPALATFPSQSSLMTD